MTIKTATKDNAGSGMVVGYRVPVHPSELSAEYLTELIGQMRPGTKVEAVEVVEAAGIGSMVSTAGRGKLRLRYASGPILPEIVQFKMIVGERGRAPYCAYETEVNMYRRMLPGVEMERPQCIAAACEAESENFILLLEDLTLRGAAFTNVLLPPYTPSQCRVLLDQLALLHAHFWESARLDEESDWLSTHLAGKQAEVFDSGLIVNLLNENVAGSTYRQDLVERIGRSPAEMWELVKAAQRHQAATIPQTLCHGDTGAHNTYALPGGGLGFLDWQFSVKAAWSHDVHYLLVTSLSVKDRRAHERELIDHYLARLAALGVPYAPSLDEAMEAYSLAIIWGLTIGWFSVWPESYGMEIITANIERLLTAAIDHDVFNRIEALS